MNKAINFYVLVDVKGLMNVFYFEREDGFNPDEVKKITFDMVKTCYRNNWNYLGFHGTMREVKGTCLKLGYIGTLELNLITEDYLGGVL